MNTNITRVGTWGILADDLTGASDSGIQWVRKGLRSKVLLEWKHTPKEQQAFSCAVMDTDSRSLPVKEAYNSVRDAAKWLEAQGYQMIYKKLDSTLRGNWAAEIEAVMDVFSFEAAVIAPAYPKMGRTTVQGVQYLNGTPVHQTEIGHDPKTPVLTSDMNEHLAAISGRSLVSIDQSCLHGAQLLNTIYPFLQRQQPPFFLFDAQTDEDLQRIGALMPIFGSRFLWCGSAGLAEFLPVKAKERTSSGLLPVHKPILVVAGSRSAVTNEQINTLQRQTVSHFVEMNSIQAALGGSNRESEEERCCRSIQTGLNQGLDVVLSASRQSIESTGDGRSNGWYAAKEIEASLGYVSAKLVLSGVIGGLVLTGGDTAKAVCKQLKVPGIELIAEVEPGIPLGVLLGDVKLPVITKAGAFGGESALLHAIHFLKGSDKHV